MKFAVTFQQRYMFDTHPVIPEIDHRSFIVIEADDELGARKWLGDQLSNNYAFIYDYDDEFVSGIEKYELHEVELP